DRFNSEEIVTIPERSSKRSTARTRGRRGDQTYGAGIANFTVMIENPALSPGDPYFDPVTFRSSVQKHGCQSALFAKLPIWRLVVD
ncbi:MAG: hypothetical protein AAAB35_23215, partial [Phyllobacterium sp.]|uniref:hypothetical protein n=1 Tax=Phyllobacterium sp. TaxID=1871046 RepID=UPI0030EFDA3C